jgi:hypothetical protein
VSPADSAARQRLGRSRGGLSTKIHLACDERGRPVSVVLSAGQAGDAPHFEQVMAGVRCRSMRSAPEAGWGELLLWESAPETGASWSETGKRRDRRQLKHRAKGDTRPVPCPPPLTTLLHDHLRNFGPGAPWLRGTNENTNGGLRQYFRKAPMSTHDAEDLRRVEHRLNHRPRKTLGWRTPADVFTRRAGNMIHQQRCDGRWNPPWNPRNARGSDFRIRRQTSRTPGNRYPSASV